MGECLIVRRGGEAYELPTLNASYPANVTVMESGTASASFSVQIATPGKPAEYTYQWYVNSAKVGGATGSSYTKAGLTASATYSVYCVVTNKAGTATSRMATLTVESSAPAFTYSGTYQLINDGGYNWRLKLLTSGTLAFSRVCANVNAFLVGGGGGDGNVNYPGPQSGGGGGYTKTATAQISRNTSYSIVVGAGGGRGAAGGTTSALGSSVGGGYPGNSGFGGKGGSGGGAYLCNGGSNGGGGGSSGDRTGGAGQGFTTREFGETAGALYSPGGSGGSVEGIGTSPGAGLQGTNSGSGGTPYGVGGSGIVIIRNAR